MIFNRFAVEESMKWQMLWWWWKPDLLTARVLTVVSGAALGLLGLLIMLGYLD